MTVAAADAMVDADPSVAPGATATAAEATPRRVLVTGGSGFIGRACLPQLVERGLEVHAVSSRAEPLAVEGVRWHRADLLDPATIEPLCERVGADVLLHLAWVTTPGVYTRTPANLDWVAASLRLARAAVEHGATRLVSAGTCFEYRHALEPCVERSTPLVPDTLYGAAKVSLGGLLEAFAAEVGVGHAWGRVFFLHGPHEHPDRLVSSVVRSLLAGETAACSAGTQERDFLHVADVAGAFAALVESDVQGPVNVASGEVRTVRDIVVEIGEQIGRPELVALGARPMSPRDPPLVVADIARLRDEVGFRPRFDWRDGLRDTIAWWRSHQATTHSEGETPS